MRLSPFREIAKVNWLGEGRQTGQMKCEQIRQWLLSELTESYFYPIGWLAERLQLLESDQGSDLPKGFFGFTLLSAKGDPFLWASIQPGKAGRAEECLRETLRTAPFARLGICTDGTVEGTRVLRQRSNSEESDIVPDLEPFVLSAGQNLLGPYPAFVPRHSCWATLIDVVCPKRFQQDAHPAPHAAAACLKHFL